MTALGLVELSVAASTYLLWNRFTFAKVFASLIISGFACYHAIQGLEKDCGCTGSFSVSLVWIYGCMIFVQLAILLSPLKCAARQRDGKLGLGFGWVFVVGSLCINWSGEWNGQDVCERFAQQTRRAAAEDRREAGDRAANTYVSGNLRCQKCRRKLKLELLSSQLRREEVVLLLTQDQKQYLREDQFWSKTRHRDSLPHELGWDRCNQRIVCRFVDGEPWLEVRDE